VQHYPKAESFSPDEVCGGPVGKQAKVYFLTAYLEYLYDQGIKSEYHYVSDASRFLRYLIQAARPEDIEAFMAASPSPASRRRLAATLRKFYAFASDRLDVDNNPFENSPRTDGPPLTTRKPLG